MLFNSIDFAIFLPTVFILYWCIPAKALLIRNSLLLIASYFFYGWWDPRFLGLIAISTIVDHTAARSMAGASDLRRKQLLWLSILVNLGMLGYFKYSNWFLDQFQGSFKFFGNDIAVDRLDIILPVGISFYTFQTLSYTIDVYRRTIPTERDPIAFAAYVSFFPQLVAGPIERASSLLPQFKKVHRFSRLRTVDGLRQILWGFFKKLVIADNCAVYVDMVFESPGTFSASTLVLGAVLFAIQIYGDFSGYSDIAIGTARLFGFDLMRNFAYPYFSRDIAEFWRRWHISLSTWFRDYLYVPLGGSRGTRTMTIRNTFLIFVISGFWHGANWTFVFWGALHALFFLPLLLTGRNRRNLAIVAHDRSLPAPKEALGMMITFACTTFAWILFRANDMDHAMEYLAGIFDPSLFRLPKLSQPLLLPLITMFFIMEWSGRREEHTLKELMGNASRSARWTLYSFIIFMIGLFARTDVAPFIYFQF